MIPGRRKNPSITYPHISTWSLHSQRASRGAPRLSRRRLFTCTRSSQNSVGIIFYLHALKIFTTCFILSAWGDLWVVAKFALMISRNLSHGEMVNQHTSRWAQTWQQPHLSSVNPDKHSFSKVYKRFFFSINWSSWKCIYHWTFRDIAWFTWFCLCRNCCIANSQNTNCEKSNHIYCLFFCSSAVKRKRK